MGGRVPVLVAAAVVLAATLSGAGPAGAASPACGDVLTADTTLTADLTCAGEALAVAAPGVTLDLGGHTITGPGSRRGPATGVAVVAAGVRVRNGTIRDFGSGVTSSAGQTHVTGLRLVGNGLGALFVSDGNRFQGNLLVGSSTGVRVRGDLNLVDGNALRRTGTGVFTSGSENSVVGNSIVGDRDPDVGILASGRTRVSGNSVSGQPGAAGIFAASGITDVTGNRVFGNLDGISIYSGTVSGNLVFDNRRNGVNLELSGSVVVTANTAVGNAQLGIRGGPGAVDGGGNRASGNGDPRQCTVVVCSP